MIQRIARAAVLPFLVCALAVAGQASTPRKAAPKSRPAPQRNAPAAPTVAFEKFVLGNGLQVILHVDRKLPIVHVNEWFHVGSKNEKPGRTGFAHLFEHEMFEGSKNAPGKYFGRAERAGRTSRRGASTGRPTTTGPTISSPCRRAASSTCSGSSRTGSRRSATT